MAKPESSVNICEGVQPNDLHKTNRSIFVKFRRQRLAVRISCGCLGGW